MESEKILCCLSLRAIILTLGVVVSSFAMASFILSIHFKMQASNYVYISLAGLITYSAPAIAFIMMLMNKEDLRSRKRFHTAYLCSVTTNCMFRLFLVIMVIIYYSFYI